MSYDRGYQTASGRWSRLGPYYAMFPTSFAYDVVKTYSEVGDGVLDPFAGRGSSIFAAATLGRTGTGIEINPVGWVYGVAKLNPATKEEVISRCYELAVQVSRNSDDLSSLPEFYRICYCDRVLKYLVCARKLLDWRGATADRTLMAIILTYLHGKLGEGLSNQMRQTKAMGMQYSVDWWKSNGYHQPPEIDPVSLLLQKIEWRYKKGRPQFSKHDIHLGDSTQVLKDGSLGDKKYNLLFTSPPYYAVTDYHLDQWIRLWMLGGSEYPARIREKNKGRFDNMDCYRELLLTVFEGSKLLLSDNAIIYIRTGKRKFTYNTTLEVLSVVFPEHNISIIDRSLLPSTRTQTKLYGDTSLKPGEVDFILKAK